jgi:spore cortex biosynthesis protein YabQ
MASQAMFFVWTMALGAVSGAVFDVFRIIRRIVRHSDFLTQIEDLLYWLFVSVLIFYFILHHNSGEVRIYAIIGVFSGMCLYFLTLSRLVVKLSLFVIGIIKKIIAMTIRILLLPIRLTAKLLSYPARALQRWSAKRYDAGRRFARHSRRFAGIKAASLKKEMYIIRKKI